jgi:hypothetical protein
MPVTPFHFGPGIFIKSVLRRNFSLFVFICSQIMIDFETLWNILSGHQKLHTFFHTYLGSLVIVCILTLIAKPLFKVTMWFWSDSKNVEASLKQVPISIIIFSALIGVWAHVFLDSIMHQDITPLKPFSDANPFLGIVSLEQLHLGCIFSGILGGIIWALRSHLKSRRQAKAYKQLRSLKGKVRFSVPLNKMREDRE